MRYQVGDQVIEAGSWEEAVAKAGLEDELDRRAGRGKYAPVNDTPQRLQSAFQAGRSRSGWQQGSQRESAMYQLGSQLADAETNLANNQRWAQQNPRYADVARQYQQQIQQIQQQFQQAMGGGGGGGAGGPPAQQAPVDSVTQSQILEALAGGAITEAEALERLERLGVPRAQAQSSIDARLRRVGAGAPPPAPARDNVPLVQPQPVAQPQDFIKRLQGQLGPGDFARRKVMESGIAPMFRQFGENLIGEQEFPFALQQAMGGDVLNPDPQAAFSSFLQGLGGGGLGGAPQMGQQLRQAGNFLRAPGGPSGLLSPGQEALMPFLIDPTNQAGGANVGSQLFAPAIQMMTQGRGLNYSPGLGAAGRSGARNFLQNYLAQNPTAFRSPTEFLDFAQQQGLI